MPWAKSDPWRSHFPALELGRRSSARLASCSRPHPSSGSATMMSPSWASRFLIFIVLPRLETSMVFAFRQAHGPNLGALTGVGGGPTLSLSSLGEGVHGARRPQRPRAILRPVVAGDVEPGRRPQARLRHDQGHPAVRRRHPGPGHALRRPGPAPAPGPDRGAAGRRPPPPLPAVRPGDQGADGPAREPPAGGHDRPGPPGPGQGIAAQGPFAAVMVVAVVVLTEPGRLEVVGPGLPPPLPPPLPVPEPSPQSLGLATQSPPW